MSGVAGEIRGDVFDASTGAGLAGVIVTMPGQGAVVTRTDDVGRFTLRGLPLGASVLKFTRSGFISDDEEIEIKATGRMSPGWWVGGAGLDHPPLFAAGRHNLNLLSQLAAGRGF